MQTAEVTAIVTINLAIVGIISTFLYRMFRELKSVREEEEQKRNRIWTRLDEVKETTKKEYVNKDICKIIHDNTNEKLKRIEEQTACVPKIKAGLDLLLKQSGLKSD